MAKCPNCGQETSGDYCQWCKYPVIKDIPEGRRKVEKAVGKEADEAPHAVIIIDPVKQVEDCLKEVEVICEDLKAGKVKTREALERLSNIV